MAGGSQLGVQGGAGSLQAEVSTRTCGRGKSARCAGRSWLSPGRGLDTDLWQGEVSLVCREELALSRPRSRHGPSGYDDGEELVWSGSKLSPLWEGCNLGTSSVEHHHATGSSRVYWFGLELSLHVQLVTY